MLRTLAPLILVLTACPGPAKRPNVPPPRAADGDPDGPHRAAVAAQVKPYLDAEMLSTVVIGLYDGGKLEIYGFGKGPGGAPPTGKTLYELGSITKVYTSLLLADSVQRREVTLDTPVSELLPPGITVPSKDKQVITLKQLALHASGLPRVPPSLGAEPKPDRFAGYTEERLFEDLLHTELTVPPGTRIEYSDFGTGLLGYALGKKIGGGYAAALKSRVLGPLGLTDTTLGFPPAQAVRAAQGTDDDLRPTPPWTFDALAGAGALVSDARDQLKLIDAELDAYAGGKTGSLRGPMRLTQEEQLETQGRNTGLGWLIDEQGRYWHAGGTGGFHTFIGFDAKTKHGIVVLASTATSLVDRLGDALFKLLDGTPSAAAAFPTPEAMIPYAGNYNLAGQNLIVSVQGKRLYIEGSGQPKLRLVPITDHEFYLEEQEAVAVFQKDGSKVTSIEFIVAGQRLSAARVDAP